MGAEIKFLYGPFSYPLRQIVLKFLCISRAWGSILLALVVAVIQLLLMFPLFIVILDVIIEVFLAEINSSFFAAVGPNP